MDEIKPDPVKPSGKRKNGLARGLTVLFVVLLVLGFGAWFAAPTVLERLAVDQLNRLGVQQVSLDVSEVTLEKIVVRGLEIGDDGQMKLSNLRAEFSWQDLLSQRMNRITLVGLRMRLKRDGGQLSFGALDPLFLDRDGAESGEQSEDVVNPATSTRWPIDDIFLKESTMEIEGPGFTTIIDFDGRLTQDPDLNVLLRDFQFSVETREISLAATAQARLGRDGSISAVLDIAGAELNLGALSMSVESGHFETEIDLNDLPVSTGHGELVVSNASLPLGLEVAGRVDAILAKGDATVALDARLPGDTATTALLVSLIDAFGTDALVALNAELSVNNLAALEGTLFPGLGLDGEGRLTLRSEVPLQDVLTLPDAATPEDFLRVAPPVSVSVSVPQGYYAPLDLTFSANAGMIATASELGAALYLDEPLDLYVDSRSELVLDPLSEILTDQQDGQSGQDAVSGHLEVAAKDGPVLVLSGLDTVTPSVTTNVAFEADSSLDSELRGSLSGSVRVDSTTGAVVDFNLPWLEIEGASARFQNTDIKIGALRLSGSGNTSNATGTLLLQSSVQQPEFGSYKARLVDLDATYEFDYSNDLLSLGLDDCMRVTGKDIRLPIVQVSRDVDICIRAPNGTAFRIPDIAGLISGTSEDLSLREIDLELVPGDIEIGLDLDDGLPLYVQSVRARGAIEGELLVTPTAIVPDVVLNLWNMRVVQPTHRITANPINLTVGAKGSSLDIEGRIGRLSQQVDTPYLRPGAISVDVEMRGEKAEFATEITVPETDFEVTFEGNHDIGNGRGAGKLIVPPFRLDAEDRSLSQVSPWLATILGETSWLGLLAGDLSWQDGDIGLEGDVVLQQPSAEVLGLGGAVPRLQAQQLALQLTGRFAGDQSDLTGELLVENLDGEIGSTRIAGVNGVIDIADLIAGRTNGFQTLAVRRVDVGIPLLDGKIAFQTKAYTESEFDEFLFNTLGGEAELVDLDFQPPERFAGTLELRKLDLEKLADVLDLGDFSVTGLLSGALPMSYENGVVTIENGSVKAEESGKISLASSQAAAALGAAPGRENVLQDVFSDFQYSALELGVSLVEPDPLSIGVRLKGSNPSYYDGFPVDVELNINGDLLGLAAGALDAYTVPTDIVERMRNFGN